MHYCLVGESSWAPWLWGMGTLLRTYMLMFVLFGKVVQFSVGSMPLFSFKREERRKHRLAGKMLASAPAPGWTPLS